jgi:hypothetical protein
VTETAETDPRTSGTTLAVQRLTQWLADWDQGLSWVGHGDNGRPFVRNDLAVLIDHANETLTKHDLGLHKLALVAQGERIDQLADEFTALRAQVAGAFDQLQQLIIQTAPACATCLHEERQGARPGRNLANTIIDGTAYCNEHLDDVGGRLVPRKTSGLIITGG